MIGIIMILGICCLFTIFLEFLAALCMYSKRQWIKSSVICNLITNPILNLILFIILAFIESSFVFLLSVLVLEIIVFIVEAFIHKKVLNKKIGICLLFSFISNTFSFIIGGIISGVLSDLRF